jgi:hypothetical protein
MKKRAPKKQPSPHPTFADVAQMIAPSNAPHWLPAHLEWWAQGIQHDLLADQFRPTKAQTRERLEAVEKAALLLQRELDNPSIRNLLNASRPTPRISISIADLRDLSERASLARTSPLLTGAKRETEAKRGRGKPKVPDIFQAKTRCAARIVEAWLHFRKAEPGLGNLDAAAAAQAYWLASGGTSEGHGNPLNGWYDHFKIVRDKKNSPGLLRLIWRRDLGQSSRRGRQPWYLGTYFPVPEERI